MTALPVAATMADIKPDTATPSQITVRPATADDASWVEDLQALAFGPGRFARSAFRVRERLPVDPALSLIAEIEGVAVASVCMTPISIGAHNGYLLGPLATDPAYRKRGAARRLVREVSERALAGGAAFVVLVGDEPYYGPLGFEPTTCGAIRFPGPVDPGRVLVMAPGTDLARTLAGPLAAPLPTPAA